MFRGEAARLAALMPANQGALVWPASGQVLSVMTDEGMLPLPDASVDRLLCVHCLEVAERAGPLLREMWRVLAPEGRLLIIVPNRRGVWARFDTTPFGHGRPYSRGQLERLLSDALFTPIEWSSALHMPPVDRQWLLRWATAFERIGARLWPAFAGVVMVEARKELMGAIPKGKPAKRRIRLVPARGLPRDCPQARAHLLLAVPLQALLALMNLAMASTASASDAAGSHAPTSTRTAAQRRQARCP